MTDNLPPVKLFFILNLWC